MCHRTAIRRSKKEILSFKAMRGVEDLESSTPTTLLISSNPYHYITFKSITTFPSGQSIEKRKAAAKANPKAKAKTKAKAAGKQKNGEAKTEPQAGGHFENLKEEDCADELMDDDDDENLDGSPYVTDENNGDDQEQGDNGTIFGDGDT